MRNSDRSGACFTKKGEFVTRLIAGEALVVPVKGQVGDLEAIYNLNDVAAFLWMLIDGGRGLGELVDAVCEEFEVTVEDAERDTMQFIAALEEAGMIEPSGPRG
jgi:coenzyme PQQ synthesis protein D (PqqD)